MEERASSRAIDVSIGSLYGGLPYLRPFVGVGGTIGSISKARGLSHQATLSHIQVIQWAGECERGW